MQDLSCENEFYLQGNEKKISFKSLASHLASLWNSGVGQLGNGLRMTRPSIKLQRVFRDPGFALLEERDSTGIESFHGMWDAENNHRGYGIERRFGSGWQDWAKIRVQMTGLSEDLGRDDEIERRLGSRWRDWAKIWVGMTGLSKDQGRDDGIERRLGSGWRDWAKIRVGMTWLNEDQGRDDGIEWRFGLGWRDRAKIRVQMTRLSKD